MPMPPNGGPWRQCHRTACDGYFPEHHGPILHGKRVSVERIVRVLACLAEGLGMRATARVFEVDANTVLQWLVAAAEQLKVSDHGSTTKGSSPNRREARGRLFDISPG